MPTLTETIASDSSVILRSMELEAFIVSERLAEEDIETEIIVEQPTPIAPTLLTATDLKYGDKIRLVWSGGGPKYNVYYKKSIDAVYILSNATPLSGTTTQYDVGGLEVNVSYDFIVRGVNGEETESANSNVLSATPTIDLTESHFTTPTWSVEVNSILEPRAHLARVELGYGNDVSNATFEIHEDPDTGSFPVYNDDVEIFINGRSMLEGKIKGITKMLSTGGLGKRFTVLSNITQYQEKVVDTEDSTWNDQQDTENLDENKSTAREILSAILGYIPSGTPDEIPGELHLNDQTKLDATDTVLRKLGNYRLYFNKDTELLEVYTFGQGGDVTRQFVKGKNLIQYNITENRENVVDKITLIGAKKLIRSRRIMNFSETELQPDSSGRLQPSFILNEVGVQDIDVEGTQRAEPLIEYQTDIEVVPEDMVTLSGDSLGNPDNNTILDEIPSWPFFPLAQKYGNAKGDNGIRHPIRSIQIASATFDPIGVSIVYNTPNQARVFLGQAPQVWEQQTVSAFVERRTVGIPEEGAIALEVLTRLSWFPGSLRISFTVEQDPPQTIIGSGTVERTITDTQYQIFQNIISEQTFDNESEVLAVMQTRAQAEYDRLNRPEISGTITVLGDETIDLKSTVLVDGQQLDVVRVVHDVASGYTTEVTLTNEKFAATIRERISRPDENSRESERRAYTRFRIQREEGKIDKNIATQRHQTLQERFGTPNDTIAVVQD